MKGLKIQDLQEGKIYNFYSKEGINTPNRLYRVNNNRNLIVTFEDEVDKEYQSGLSYNTIINGYFIEIEREIDWNKVPRGTKVQVRDDENQEWENRYFIKYIPSDDKEYPFKISKWLDDNYINLEMEYLCDVWKYCRIHESVQIPEEWYKEME